MKSKSLKIPLPDITVSAILDEPKGAFALLTLAHGAGAGMAHSGMQFLADALNARGIATLRYQLPFMERGSRRPDSPKVAVAAIAGVVQFVATKFPKLPLFAGGKSFGGRMTTTAASQGQLAGICGILCFGFPLHPPKKPGLERAEHLEKVIRPMLWIQGTRDDLAELKLVRKVVKQHPLIQLHILDAADHSFQVLKSSDRTPGEIAAEIGAVSEIFCREQIQ